MYFIGEAVMARSGLTDQQSYIRKKLVRLRDAIEEDGGEVTATGIAGRVASDVGHPEWLDDPKHWIWGLAIGVVYDPR